MRPKQLGCGPFEKRHRFRQNCLRVKRSNSFEFKLAIWDLGTVLGIVLSVVVGAVWGALHIAVEGAVGQLREDCGPNVAVKMLFWVLFWLKVQLELL